MIIVIKNQCGQNATKAVVEALQQLITSGGGTLLFEKGEYHFFEENTIRRFFAVSNNSACEKNIAILIENADGLTVDGGGSVFVFHELVFPIVITNSKNVTIKNIIFDRVCSPFVQMQMCDISNKGFKLAIDREKFPYHIDNGALVFERDWGEFSGLDHIFDLHAHSVRHNVEYLVTGDCRESTKKLAAGHVCTDVEEVDGGVYCRYRTDREYSHHFFEGEHIMALIDGRRDFDMIFAQYSETLKISDIEIRCAVGMGFIAQCSRDIEIDKFRTALNEDGECVPLTADALHFVNCSGNVEIHNCRITDTADDAINVHGMYTEVERVEENTLYVRIMHHEQKHFMLYEKSDRIILIQPGTLDEVGEWVVENAEFVNTDGTLIKIQGRKIHEDVPIDAGFFAELPYKMPNVHVHDNEFDRYPNVRLSGSGEILVENNKFSNSASALVSIDVPKYWYESGRLGHLIFRNNCLDNCNGKHGDKFIQIGVRGKEPSDCPKIHKKVEIYGNRFSNIKCYAMDISGVRELTIRDNIFDSSAESVVLVDGKVIKTNEWKSDSSL